MFCAELLGSNTTPPNCAWAGVAVIVTTPMPSEVQAPRPRAVAIRCFRVGIRIICLLLGGLGDREDRESRRRNRRPSRGRHRAEIGRASCRERVCQYV